MLQGTDFQVDFSNFCPQLKQAAQSVVDTGYERRASRRQQVSLPCQLEPIDAFGLPKGKVIEAYTTDISSSGVGVLHTHRLQPQSMKITLGNSSGALMRLLGEVVNCTPINGYYKIGLKLVGKA